MFRGIPNSLDYLLAALHLRLVPKVEPTYPYEAIAYRHILITSKLKASSSARLQHT